MIIRISWTVSPNHGGAVDPSAVVRVTLSEPPDPATVTDTAILLKLKADNGQPSPVAKRLAIDGATITITAEDELLEASVYEVEITSELTDRQGLALENAPFLSDFTTSGVFHSANLDPGTLWVTVPERQDGSGGVEVAPDGELGAVMVCGAAALALPGTLVDVTHYNYGAAAPSGRTETITATDPDGIRDPNTNCAAILAEADYEGRCLTEVSPGEYQPGSFCVAFDNVAAGDRFLIGVEDAFGNRVEIDAGNMRDERTGEEVIDSRGGVVTFPADESYAAIVPEGAFDLPTKVRITPLTDPPIGAYGGDLAAQPVLTSFDQGKVELIGAVDLDFEGTAQVNIDISVPAPGDALEDDQYIATQIVNFRGSDEQTMVDVASYDAATDLVTTEFFDGLPLIIGAGSFGVHRAVACLAFATGFTKIGDTVAAGVVPGGILGASLPFPVTTTALKKFAVPVPCDQPLTIEITQFDSQPIDDKSCGPAGGLSRGESCQLLGPLTDDENPPIVQDTSVLEGDVAADPLAPLEVVYSESLHPDSVSDESCEVVDSEGRTVEGKCKLSADGRVITFVPDIRLRFDETYTFRIQGVTDEGGNAPLDPFQTTFSTFAPRIIGRIEGIDARDVVWIEPTSLGLSPCVDLIAVAEGGNIEGRDDHMGGIVIYDVTDPLNPTRVAEAATAGTDNALEFIVPSQPLVTVDAGTFNGPFLFSVDGIGAIQSEDRYGVFRIFELRQQSGEIEIVPVASRIVNQSANSYAALNSGDPQSTILGSAIDRVPNDVGVPMGVAGFGSQIAYVANNPFIGIQAIAFDDFVTEPLAVAQVDATMLGIYRDLDTLGNKVIAVAQVDSKSRMQIIDPGLAGVVAWEESPTGRATSVLGVEGWQARPELGSEETVSVDLAIAAGPAGVSVFAANSTSGVLTPQDISGTGRIATPGEPAGLSIDRETGLLFVADGSAGLTIVDLETPGGRLERDGIDERVLGSSSLYGAQAKSVAVWDSLFQVKTAALGTGDGGLFLVDLGLLDSGSTQSAGGGATTSALNPTVNENCEEEDRVEFGPGPAVLDDNCSGFDRSEESGPWLMVPLNGSNQVRVNSMGPKEKQLSVSPESAASVTRAGGGVASIVEGTRTSMLQISGLLAADVVVTATVDDSGSHVAIQEELNVTVRPQRSLRVAIRRILLPAEDPAQRKRLPTQGELQSYLDLVFKLQTNVAIAVEVHQDEIVNYDTSPADGGLSCGEGLLGPQCSDSETSTVLGQSFVEQAPDLKNIFVVGSIKITDPGVIRDGELVENVLHGATDVDEGLTILQDQTTNDLLQTTAHEVGHLLGLSKHAEAEGDLMHEKDQPKGSGCRLRRADWDTVNPRDPE